MNRRDFIKTSTLSALYYYFIASGLARAQAQRPLYESTQKQRDFIEKSKANEYLCEHRDLFFKNAEDIRNGKLAGSPLEDMLKIMNEERILPEPVDITQWSLEYSMGKDEIINAFALRGLEIIDGRPPLVPTQEGLIVLRESGLLEYADKCFERYFDTKRKEELRIKRQSGKLFADLDVSKSIALDLLNQYRPKTDFGEYLLQQEENSGIDAADNVRPILGAAIIYLDNRLFEEIPQRYKLVKHPVYTKLVSEPKLEAMK